MRWLAAALCSVLLVAASATHAAEHVIQISIDGLSGSLLANLVANDPAGDFASFRRFVDEGAVTFNARSDYTHTITVANHVSMLTGRPVSLPAGAPFTTHHGYTDNDEPEPWVTLHNSGNPALTYVASAFDVAHAQGLTTALFISKDKLAVLGQSYPDEIDLWVNEPAAAMHVELLAALAASHFDYVFAHYSTPDDVGHSNGWGSTAWKNAVRGIDDDLAELFALIDADPELRDRTLIILSADHGGTGSGHSNEELAANYTIPFLLWGDGVQEGVDLYALNPVSRADPGTGRPSYTAAVQPIRNGDGANLALAALGLPAVPGSSINALQDLASSSLPPAQPIPSFPALGRVALVALLSLALAASRTQ